MAKWGRNFFQKFRDKIKNQKAIISTLADRTDEIGIQQYLAELHKLDELFFHEEIYWKQREKIMWLAEGDSNTKFIHASATARRTTNHISHLIMDDGVQVEEHAGMCDVVIDYFKNIFTEDNTDTANHHEDVYAVITPAQNNALVVDMNFEEFSLAIRRMHQDKAAGRTV